jgi:pimeloyl-ACP methyl ester carboxylesterase
MATFPNLSGLREVAKHATRRLTRRLHQRNAAAFKQALPAAIDAERHAIATADAGVLSYYEDGSGRGRPLVLLHGIHAAGSAYEVKPLFHEFRHERAVYALDLPGFGFSQRGGMPYTTQTYVHALEHLLRNVAIERDQGSADVVALSLSSEYAAAVAAELPELVHSLVLISPTGFERMALGDRQRSEPPALVKAAAAVGGDLFYDALVTRPSLSRYLSKSFNGRLDRGLFAYSYATTHQPGAACAPLAFVEGKLFPDGDPKQAYARVKAPGLVLYDEDPYVKFDGLRAFVLRTPNYQAERVAHTRGLPQIEACDRTARLMRAFWERLDAPVITDVRRPTSARHYAST